MDKNENTHTGVVCEKCGHRTPVPEIGTSWVRKDDPSVGVFVIGIDINGENVVVNPVKVTRQCIETDPDKELRLSFAELREQFDPTYGW